MRVVSLVCERRRRFATAGTYSANVTYAGTQSFNTAAASLRTAADAPCAA